MKRRYWLAIILIAGIVFLAHYRVAGANPSPNWSASVNSVERPSDAAARDDGCDKEKGKDKEKCKGTVKPPHRDVTIPVTGNYSVGGFCTLSTIFNGSGIRLDATIQTPLPQELPDQVHKVRQGCLLTYYASDQRIHELTPSSGSTSICFAATPQKQMTIYFYDIYSSNPSWVPLETTFQTGIACTAANQSGVYVASFQEP